MNYIELDVWKSARELVKLVYSKTKSFPKEEIYGITNQIRRSVVSVPSNIAKGSLYEVETQLYLSFDLEYIIKDELDKTIEKVISSKKLLNGFIKYFKNKN